MNSISVAEYKSKYLKKKCTSKTKRQKVKGGSVGEATLATQLKALKIEFEREFKFCDSRKWKADFHLVGKRILVEVEGGVWISGRHTRGKGYIADMEKYNEVSKMGYVLLRFSTEQVASGLAIKEIEQLIGKGE